MNCEMPNLYWDLGVGNLKLGNMWLCLMLASYPGINEMRNVQLVLGLGSWKIETWKYVNMWLCLMLAGYPGTNEMIET